MISVLLILYVLIVIIWVNIMVSEEKKYQIGEYTLFAYRRNIWNSTNRVLVWVLVLLINWEKEEGSANGNTNIIAMMKAL